jgi:hypothetical protein
MRSIRSEPVGEGAQHTPAPWYQRSARWLDVRLGKAATLEVPWWRAYWQRLGAQGVIIPADVQGFAAVAAAAREDGLSVVARLSAGAHRIWHHAGGLNVNRDLFNRKLEWRQEPNPNGPSDKTLAAVKFLGADNVPSLCT